MNIAAAYRVKNEGRWLGESLERSLAVAERAFVFDDHSEDNTVEIAESFGKNRVAVFRSQFPKTLDEARDKTLLWQIVSCMNARWLLFIDGDEVLTPSAQLEIRSILAVNACATFFFRIAYLWDSPTQERIDGLYAHVMAPRLFPLHNQKDLFNMQFKTTDHNGNLHCGQTPEGYKGPRQDALSPIKHYGYMLEEDRQRKHAFYNSVDATAANRLIEQNYDHIIGKPTRWAPGPVLLKPFADV